MLVWVHACDTQHIDVLLEFLDLLEVVDEGFGNLLDQEGLVGHVPLDVRFYLVVGALEVTHVLLYLLLGRVFLLG